MTAAPGDVLPRQRCEGWVTVPGERPRRCPLDLDPKLAAAGDTTHANCGPAKTPARPQPAPQARPPRRDLSFGQLRAEVGRARAEAAAGHERAAAARLAAAGCTEHATGVHLARWRETTAEMEAG